MVLTLMLIVRKVLHFEDYITLHHIGAMSKIIIAMGGIVALAYATEFFVALYSGNEYERFTFVNRALGPYAWAYWIMVGCNVGIPQFLWSKKVRSNVTLVFILSLLINVGMWFERFVIITISLTRDYLPASPTSADHDRNRHARRERPLPQPLPPSPGSPMIAIGEVKGSWVTENNRGRNNEPPAGRLVRRERNPQATRAAAGRV